MDGGYTVWYQYYDTEIKSYVKKNYYCYSKKVMLSFTASLESKGYKFVGKI